MLTKLFALLLFLGALGVMGKIFLFGSLNPVFEVLVAIALLLISLWCGLWHIAYLIERRKENE